MKDELEIIESLDSSDFVILNEVIPEAFYEIRYYTTYNFVGERIDGYEEPLALMTKEAAKSLKEVSDELLAKGYKLRIYDTYRPRKAVAHFIRWSEDINDTRMRKYFYPDYDKTTVFENGFLKKNSPHSRGSTVDLTIFDMKTGKDLDMGGPFDFFGEISYSEYDKLTKKQINNRKLLRNTMISHGFKPIVKEWWHFVLEDEPYPNTYFDFPVNRKSINK